MKVLVTGGAGYLGSSLVPALVAAGHQVTVVDRLFFGEDCLAAVAASGAVKIVRDDIRWCSGSLFEGQDAVIDLAALSNDPAGELNPWKTYEINYLGRSRVARLAREAKVPRYVVTSSCSVYGFQEGILNEDSEVRPLTGYARANVLIERDNLPLATDGFCPTAVRFATLYGYSPRMRFDLAINGMVLGAARTGKIPVMRDGSQWRPFLHVRDASRALIEVLSAPVARISGRVFNIGSDDQNYQIRPLAETVAGAMAARPSVEWYGSPDARSYRVNFGRAESILGFRPKLYPADAVRELEKAIGSDPQMASPRTNTVEWYKHLLSDPAAGASVALHDTVL